ncbi:hypothetical protein BGZ73_008650, partial [Actinomortierella ambigua]
MDYFGPRHTDVEGQSSYPNTPSMPRAMRTSLVTSRDHRDGTNDSSHHGGSHDAAVVPQDPDRSSSPERTNRFSRSSDMPPTGGNIALRIVQPASPAPAQRDKNEHTRSVQTEELVPRRPSDSMLSEGAALSPPFLKKEEEPDSAALLKEKVVAKDSKSSLPQSVLPTANEVESEQQSSSQVLKTEDTVDKADPTLDDKKQSVEPQSLVSEPKLEPIQEPQHTPEPPPVESEVMILQQMDIVDSEMQRLEAELEAHRRAMAVKKLEQKQPTLLDGSTAYDAAVPTEVSPKKEAISLSEHKDAMDATSNGSSDSIAVVPVGEEAQVSGRLSEAMPIKAEAAEIVPDHNHDIEMHSPPPLVPHDQAYSQPEDGAIDSDDPFYRRRREQKRKPQLFDHIYEENQAIAQKYGRIHTGLGSAVKALPDFEDQYLKVYRSVEDYPFYQENIDNHSRMRSTLLGHLSKKAAALDEKELRLKREYKHYWEEWNKRVAKLDKIKERKAANSSSNVREEDQVTTDNNPFSSRNRRGGFTSDAVRSEAEFLEIIQSLENADMKNPDLRASRTAATVPPMILDPWVRENVHYYDRNHLVTDPATYYRLGPVTDPWTEEEQETFIRRYLQYPKQFGRIAAGLPEKTASQCVLFYYREKKKLGFKELLANRNKKKKGPGARRKEKAAASTSAGAKTKHKGSALIEDIGQANRTKQAKSSEVRELRSNWANFETLEPRRRVRSTTSNQTPLDNTSTANSAAASPNLSPSAALTAPAGKKTRTRASRANDNASAKSTPADTQGTPNSDNGPSVSTSSTTTTTAASAARWTTEESDRAFAAIKLHGKNFDEMAKAVGTKTVDQCRNFLFNYKRKFGVSALEDASNPNSSRTSGVSTGSGDGGDGGAEQTEKGRTKKPRTTATAAAAAAQKAKDTTTSTTTTTTRRRAAKQSPGITQEAAMKTDSLQEEQEASEASTPATVGDSATTTGKGRRRRTVSKVDTSSASVADTVSTSALTPSGAAATPTSHMSFRALYSRPPDESPSTPGSEPPAREGSATPDGSAKGKTATSSYWSRQEKIDFDQLLAQHGKDWEKIAKALKTKTHVQVRNYYNTHASRRLAAEEAVAAGSQPPDGSEPMQTAEPTAAEMALEGERPQEQTPTPNEYPASVPRKVTNIANLLNMDNGNVHNTAEDWFNENEAAEQSNEPTPSHAILERTVVSAKQEPEMHPMPLRRSSPPPSVYDGPVHGRSHASPVDYGTRRPDNPATNGHYSSGYDNVPMSAHQRPPASDSPYNSTPILGSPYAGYSSSGRPESPPVPMSTSAGPPMHRMSSPVHSESSSPGGYYPGHQRSRSRQLQPVVAPVPHPPTTQGYYGSSHHPSYSTGYLNPPQQRESHPVHVRSNSDYPS